MRRIALNRADIKSILQLRKQIGPDIDHDDIVVLASQAGEQTAAHLPGPKNDDFHGSLP